jgi:hypothetical protein
MERVEEILEVAQIVDEAADRLVAVLQRSGADQFHAPQMLREIVRCQLDSAAVETACLVFGSPMTDGSHAFVPTNERELT